MKIIIKLATSVLLFVIFSSNISAQVAYSSSSNNLILTGTSTIHDWEMESKSGECKATFQTDASGKLTDLSAMTFTVSAKTLKSGKDAMDKNAYKALKTDKSPNLKAVLKSCDLSSKDKTNYTFNAVVSLTIAGKTIDTPLKGNMKVAANNSITVTGEKTISMGEFNMEPPSFMMGAVKTGDVVVLKFNTVLNPQPHN